jgi:hypothetical protein
MAVQGNVRILQEHSENETTQSDKSKKGKEIITEYNH